MRTSADLILSVHIAEVGPAGVLRLLRAPPDDATPGLRYATTFAAAPLRRRRLGLVEPGRICLVAAWDGDRPLDAFLQHHPVAQLLADGWRARLKPVRAWGRWSELPDLPGPGGGDVDGPVAVLTLGRLRLRRARPFLAASLRAEREAQASPAMVAGTALARPPRLVATFSIWSGIGPMRDYVAGPAPGGHHRAIEAHRARPFHDESAFIRFRPYDTAGRWEGVDPVRIASGRML